MWVPFDLNTVSMVIILTLIGLFFVLWGFNFWREKHEEEHYKHHTEHPVAPENPAAPD